MEPSHREILQALTLDAISNDYENFQMVVSEVSRWAKQRQLVFSIDEIADMLLSLVDGDLATTAPPEFADQRDRRGDLENEDIYFKITAKGRLANAELLKDEDATTQPDG